MNKTLIKIAGLINLFTALIHLIGGQYTLVSPLLNSSLENQTISEWIGAWHMISIILFYTSIVLLKTGFSKTISANQESLVKFIGWLYIMLSIPFILSSFYFETLVSQWILLIPIGLVSLLSRRK